MYRLHNVSNANDVKNSAGVMLLSFYLDLIPMHYNIAFVSINPMILVRHIKIFQLLSRVKSKK